MTEAVRHALWWAQDYAWAAFAAAATVAAPATEEHYASGDRRPVLVLPGVFESWRFVRPLIQSLHQQGHPAFVIEELGANRLPIAGGAALVLDTLRHKDLSDVTVVAHSKGGLVGKLAMLRDDEQRISAMVTICTPFAGSSRAQLLALAGTAEMLPDAPLIRSLAEQHQVDHRITTVSVRYDQHVPEGTTLAGAHNLTLPISGHFRATAHPATIAVVAAALTDEGTRGRAAVFRAEKVAVQL